MKRLFFLFSGILLACSGENEISEPLKTDYPYHLAEWPDSLYIASLDSVLALEPIRKDGDSSKTEIIINSFKAPAFIPLPQTPANSLPKVPQESQKTAKIAPQNHFVSDFSAALSQWQSDPSNQKLYREIEARADEDLLKLLSRAYQTSTAELPRFYTLTALQSVNPGIALEHLQAGDKVKIPRL